jgi:tRNA-dihydrouridine synthase B
MRSLTTLPLTIKMRAGFKEKNALEVVQLAQACGVNAIAIHPRLQTQQFGGTPDYNLVHNIKKISQIPILYSGGIHCYTQAQEVYEKTGVDGFLISRALCGAPWKLAQLEAETQGKNFIITSAERCQAALNHLALLIKYYGPRGLYHFRKHIPFYIQEQEGAVAARKKLLVATHIDEVINEFKKFFGV